jgi:hypothetical protein
MRETGTGQQVAQLHDRYMMMMMTKDSYTRNITLKAFAVGITVGSKGEVPFRKGLCQEA